MSRLHFLKPQHHCYIKTYMHQLCWILLVGSRSYESHQVDLIFAVPHGPPCNKSKKPSIARTSQKSNPPILKHQNPNIQTVHLYIIFPNTTF